MTEHPFDPILTLDPAPDHAPGFWDNLEAAMAADVRPASRHGGSAGDATTELPVASPVSLDERRNRHGGDRRPFALAAALVAVLGMLGLGAFTLFGSDGDGGTAVLAGDLEADVAPAPADGVDGGDDSVDDAATGDASTDGSELPAPLPSTIPIENDTDTSDGSAEPVTDTEPADSAAPADPGGSGDEPVRVVQGAVVGSLPERGLIWSTIEDQALDCTDARYATLSVLGDGESTPRMASTPQRHYSGEVSSFTLSPDTRHAAWLVACGTQLELHVAQVAPSGALESPQLIWVGDGTADSALILWDGEIVSLNVLVTGIGSSYIDYDTGNELAFGTAGNTRFVVGGTPLAATPDGSMRWYHGWEPVRAADFERCAELPLHLLVEDDTGTRRGDLLPADLTPFRDITSAAYEQSFSQLAVADRPCTGSEAGRIVIASVRADGTLTAPIDVDLSAYVPGYATEMAWLDETTLWFRTDNAEFGVPPVEYELSLADGRDDPILTRLPG